MAANVMTGIARQKSPTTLFQTSLTNNGQQFGVLGEDMAQHRGSLCASFSAVSGSDLTTNSWQKASPSSAEL